MLLQTFAISVDKKTILTNPEVIAIDQDPLGTAGDRVFNHSGGAQVWAKRLQNGDQAVVLYNSNHDIALKVVVSWDMIGWAPSASVKVRDLWQRKDMGTFTTSYQADSLGPHDVMLLRVTLG